MVEDLSRFQNPKFARFFMKLSARADRGGGAEKRRRLLAGLSGQVVEVGAGHGLNFAHYPAQVTEVVAVEPDDTLRAVAERNAKAAPVPVIAVAGHADALPVADGTADAVVFSLVLCSVPGQAHSLAEAVRVLRPGGQIRFYEHVRSAGRLRGRFQDLIAPVWARKGGGCHPNRDTVAAIESAGLVVEDVEDFTFSGVRFFPRMRHVIGRATKG